MSFGRTDGSIKNLEGNDKISLDAMFHMLVCVVQDIKEHNGVASIQESGVIDSELLVKKAVNLIQTLLPICKTQQEGLASLSASWQARYKDMINELENVIHEFEIAKEEIEKIEITEKELQKKHGELRATRAHLLTATEECKKLQSEIDMLSDTNLESAVLEKQGLEEELNKRRRRNEEIVAQREIVEAELASCMSEFNALKNAVAKMKKDIEALTEQDKIVRGESHQFEEEIDALQKKLAEYKEWMSQFPAQKKNLEEKLSEEKAKHVSLINAWTSTRSDDYVKETLFKLPGSTDAFTIENYPDLAVAGTDMKDITMLEAWFEQIQKRVDGLLKLQETMVRTVVQQVEQITADN